MIKRDKTRPQHSSKTVGFIALGCPKNMVDAEAMLARIGMAGYILTPETDNADLVVINTCGFIEPAKQEAFKTIRQVLRHKKQGRVRKVIVTGCLSQRLGEELADEIHHIDAIVGLAGRDNIEQVLTDLQNESGKADTRLYLGPTSAQAPDDRNRLRITPPHWAYLRISEGCSRRCAFCTIPAIRGHFRSKPMELIVEEARQLVDSGAKELSLIAQDSNSYGRDMGLENGLASLLGELEKIPSLHWIRLMYLYPAGIDETLLRAIADNSKVVHYIDMPVQHISDSILKAMRRAHTRTSTLGLIEQIRRTLPDIVLRTTVIAGFPGETEASFQELLDFIRQAQFDALGCFPFYPEDGTPAAQLPGLLPPDIRQQRADEVMLTQQAIAFGKIEKRIGTQLTVLVDEITDKGCLGRYYGQAPEIDSVCLIGSKTAAEGQFLLADVLGRNGYDLTVRPAKK